MVHKTYFKLKLRRKQIENKFKINGLWIPYQILTDKNLKDKEKIIYSLERKLYSLVDIKDYFYKNNHKEILYRKIKPIRKNEDTYCKKVQDEYYQKVQQDNPKNVNVLKSKNKNYKKYNKISNYEGREYEPEFLETLYAIL